MSRVKSDPAPDRRSLRFQVAIAIFSTVAVSSLLFAALLLYANRELEYALYDLRVEQELEDFKNRLREDPKTAVPRAHQIRGYLRNRDEDFAVPDWLAALPPGNYHDFELDDRFFHIAIEDFGDDRIYMVMDVTELEQKEGRLEILILASGLALPLLAIWGWYWWSRRITRPLAELAGQLSNLDPAQRNPALAGRHHGYEVELIARSFDRYAARVDGFVRREQDFTAAASHELRTPLAVISSAADLLAVDAAQDVKRQAALERIRRSARDMAELLTALLFLARDAGKRQPVKEEIDLAGLARTLVDKHRSDARDAEVSLEVLALAERRFNAPASLAAIVVSNLLRNAIGAPGAKRVRIVVDGLDVQVEDDGLGVEPELEDKLFARGAQGAHSKGEGLGLYLVKRVCDRCGWRVSVTGREQGGTRATLSFAPA